jgi:alanine dehydrogenase
MSMTMLTLSREEIQKVLTYEDAIEAVEESFRALASGGVKSMRGVIDVSEHGGTLLTMGAYINQIQGLGIKIVAAFKDNVVKFGKPTISANILLFEPKTGELMAMMEGSFITAVRTGAASAVATRYLARSDAHALGIIGTGIQGKTHLAAISKVRDIDRYLAYDVDAGRLAKFISEVRLELGVDVRATASANEVVDGSDIIATCTTASEPVLIGKWLRKGTHVNSIMAINPTMRELDDETIIRSKIVVDDKDAALKEAGDLVIPIKNGRFSADRIYAELGEIVVGRKEGRTDDDEITLFKAVGTPSHDINVAARVYELASKSKMAA